MSLSEIEACLRQFGQEGLKPSKDYVDKGKEFGQKVFLKLQKELPRRFSIAETRFAGSIGKKTSVLQPDLDLVVVVNKCPCAPYTVVNKYRPPFDAVLLEFEEILLKFSRELKIKEGSIKRKSSFSIQFEFTCGIEVDLLPAADLSIETIHQLIAKNPDNFYEYSSSLVKRQLDFMTSHQSNFVHIIIRLTKFWYKSLCFGDDYLSGGGLIMELIGIAAAVEEEEYDDGSASVLRAFADVINKICNIKSLKLAFKVVKEVDSRKLWKAVKQDEWQGSTLIPKVIGTYKIFKKECFIIEPANPFNDLLGGNTEEAINKLINFAKVTERRISNLMSRYDCLGNNHIDREITYISELFKPQPFTLTEEYPNGSPNEISIRCKVECNRLYPFLEVDGDEELHGERKWAVESIKLRLVAAVTSIVKLAQTNPAILTNEDIVNKVAEKVPEEVKGWLNIERENNWGEHAMDVILTVPYEVDGFIYAVKLGMSWNAFLRGVKQMAKVVEDVRDIVHVFKEVFGPFN